MQIPLPLPLRCYPCFLTLNEHSSTSMMGVPSAGNFMSDTDPETAPLVSLQAKGIKP